MKAVIRLFESKPAASHFSNSEIRYPCPGMTGTSKCDGYSGVW